MSRTMTSQQASLLPFLQPSNSAPRLALTEWVTDASYPFAVVDNSAPFSRIIRGSYLTAAGSCLKDVFLVLQRDQYRLENTTFGKITNSDIEASWDSIISRSAATVGGDGLIGLSPARCDGEKMRTFAPLLFCREKKIFLPVLCPSCASELELCKDDELLQQKELQPYSASVRRYLYCPSCSSTQGSEFFVREREDTDPLFLLDFNDLVSRLLHVADSAVAKTTFPCAACPELYTCLGSENIIRSRVLPFSFYPFHLLMVEAPALNALDFAALLSGADCGDLSDQIDRRSFPGRISSLNAIEVAGPVKWVNFAQRNERAFPELLLLKLSILEEVVGRVAADSNTTLRGERVWTYVPKVSRNLPAGWNFSLLFLDDLTPMTYIHDLERSQSMALARTGLFFFQVLLSSRDVAAGSIVEAVSQYLSDKSGEVGGAGTSSLKAMCVPANIFRNPEGYVLNRLYEEPWNNACIAGFALLDAARGRGSMSCTEIHHALVNLLEVIRNILFSTVQTQVESESVVTEQDDEKVKLKIHKVVSEMIMQLRDEVSKKPSAPPDNNFDEVVETVILRAGAAPEPLVSAMPSAEDVATIILPSEPPVQKVAIDKVPDDVESELQETVIMSSQRPVLPNRETVQPEPPPSVQQHAAVLPEQEDDLAETVMIIPTAGRNRPGGAR